MARCGWRPAAVAVVVYLLCDLIGSARGQSCDAIGCCYENQYTKYTCNLSGRSVDYKQIRGEQLEEVKITQGLEVSLKGGALPLAQNNKLHSLLFTDIQRLNMESNSTIQLKANRDFSLTARRIGDLRLKNSAFFGWQSELATLSISDTETVRIDLATFPAGSHFHQIRFFNITTLTLETGAIFSTIGRLELENIRSLQLSHGAIRGVIETLDMHNVSIKSCPSRAIGGSIGLVSLRFVKLLDVESRCLDDDRGWGSLTIIDSRLGHLPSHSINGNIENISISGCQIASVGPAAVSATAAELSISNSTVGELGGRSLQVEAAVSVTLRRVSVSYLRQDALRGLRVTNTTSSGISVSGLTVQRAEPGSLRFADGVLVTLTNLQLTGSCICSTPSWARQLLLGPSGGDRDSLPSRDGLAERRDTLLRQIEAGLCTAGGYSVSLADFTARHCGASAGAGGLSDQPADRSAPLASGWSYLGVVLLAALLLAVTVLLITVIVRFRRHHLQQRPKRPERLELTESGEADLCLADGPAACGQQREDNSSRRPVLPNGATDQEPEALYSEMADLPNGATDQEPEALYSEVAEYPSDDGDQTVERSPLVGKTRREPLNAISPRAEECCCPTNGLYAVSAKIERCSCKAPRLTDSEPVYSDIPGGGMRDEPAAGAGPDDDDDLRPPGHSNTKLDTDTAGGERSDLAGHAAPGYAEDLPDYAEITLESDGDPRPTEYTCHMTDNLLYGSAV